MVLEPRRRWTVRETIVCFLLAAMIVTGYFTVWRFEFVYFDDPGYLTDNLNVLRGLPLFRSPDRGRKPQDPPLTSDQRAALRHKNVEDFKASVYWAFTAFEQSNWHPLTWLSHMLDVEIYGSKAGDDLKPGDGLGAGGHHLTNIILHSLNALLLFGLFWRLTGMTWGSAVVAAMFAVHPMHVESVAWVAERKDVLSTFLGFLTLHAYVTYGRHARFNGALILYAMVFAAVIGILGWLWYYQCFWYLQQVVFFQQHQIVRPPNPQGYEALALTGPGLGGFAMMLIVGLGAAAGFAASTGRTRLLKSCVVLLIFVLIGLTLLTGLWNLKAFVGKDAQVWTNGFGVAVILIAMAGGIAAAIQGRTPLVVQCGIFVACVAALLLVLSWIQLPAPKSPQQAAWYNNPFETAVERIWCTEVALAIFVVFGSLAVDAVWGRRSSLGLYCIVLVLYMVGLLAKPMLVTLPFVMLLIDYWPLKRIDSPAHEEEKSAVPAADAARIARRRARERRKFNVAGRQAAAVAVQPLPGTSLSPLRRMAQRALFLVLEKMPLLVLAAISSVVTPIAQSHGGSMASANDLPITFRLQNATQSYAAYIGRMFWPGKMMSLHLLLSDKQGHPYIDQKWFWVGLCVVIVLTSVAAAAFFFNRRYIVFGWLWYVGMLVPVIGFVQVGEQAMADRYTYTPYIGLFVAIVWGIGDLLDRFPQWRRPLVFFTAGAAACILASWISWTNYQIQTWHDRERHLRHALTVEPDNWNMLNNLGVHLWKEGDDEDHAAQEAEAVGNAPLAAECRAKMQAFKDDAMAQWIHGITSRPTATDIHSNLGYAYSEKAALAQDAANQLNAAAAKLEKTNPDESTRKLEEGKRKQDEANNFLDRAEFHLTEAVRLKDISPRPHNNLGRVLLRRSQQYEIKANAEEAKGKTDPAAAAKAKSLHAQAKLKRNLAILQFERAVQLDPSLLEAHLNLGEVYTQMGNEDKADLDKAEEHYLEIRKYDTGNVIDKGALANFSQACYGLARIAIAKNKPDEAVQWLKLAIAKNPGNMTAIDLLIGHSYARGDYRTGDQVVWLKLSRLPAGFRRPFAEQFGKQFESDGKTTPQGIHAWGTVAWIFATSPEPQLRDPQAALVLGQHVVELTKGQDPLALDTLAAAQAANGQFADAVRTAQQAVSLANSAGNKPLAEAIAQRLSTYQRQTPYLSKSDGSDRP